MIDIIFLQMYNDNTKVRLIDVLEVRYMATKSMLKDIAIKNNKFGLEFANALERAAEESETLSEKEETKVNCIEIIGDKIKEFFGVI